MGHIHAYTFTIHTNTFKSGTRACPTTVRQPSTGSLNAGEFDASRKIRSRDLPIEAPPRSHINNKLRFARQRR